MPTRVCQLATMFEAVIHEYYGQTAVSKARVESAASEIDELQDYIQINTQVLDLDEYIEMAAVKKKDWDRVPLMHYLARGVKIINELLCNQNPLDSATVEHIKADLSQLMIDIQLLSCLPKTEHIRLNHDETEIILHGCSGCRSGEILQKKLIMPLNHISGRVMEYISDSINAHQIPLLAKKLRRLQTMSELSENELKSLRAETERLHADISSYSRMLFKQLNEIESMRKELNCKPASQSLPERRLEHSENRHSLFYTLGSMFTPTPEQAVENGGVGELRQYELADFY